MPIPPLVAINVVTVAILIEMSVVQLPSLERVFSICLKLFSSSSCTLFI